MSKLLKQLLWMNAVLCCRPHELWLISIPAEGQSLQTQTWLLLHPLSVLAGNSISKNHVFCKPDILEVNSSLEIKPYNIYWEAEDKIYMGKNMTLFPELCVNNLFAWMVAALGWKEQQSSTSWG